MEHHYDDREIQDPATREAGLFERLPAAVAAARRAPAYAKLLSGIDASAITTREALARLPVLRKSDLPALQKADPPFGGFVAEPPGVFGRLFTSPGPIHEPEGRQGDPWRTAQGIFAAGFRPGDIVLNTFSYHMTPGGFIMDAGCRAIGCPVIPAGPGNTAGQLDLIEAYRPVAYTGTPDFLKILLDAAAESGRDVSFMRKAVVSGAAFPKSLQAEFSARGIEAYQLYATADLGLVAYETAAREGLVVAEDIILEIVRPGTGDPVGVGEVGEIVVTTLDERRPLIRLALGDLTAALPDPSPCGRTNLRIRGWLGRADQTAKVKGMFVRPEQIADVGRAHPEAGRMRLVITREGETDVMTLAVETSAPSEALAASVADSLQAATKLRGRIDLVVTGSLPNDGKVIADERRYD